MTVELQDLRFNSGCDGGIDNIIYDGGELCGTEKVFNSFKIRQYFVCHESHHMILENDKSSHVTLKVRRRLGQDAKMGARCKDGGKMQRWGQDAIRGWHHLLLHPKVICFATKF